MSDNKKYYYMRLKENFFDSDELIVLESMKDGHLYSNILLKLYLKSLKYDGRLMYNDRIPFNLNMLAHSTRQPAAVVEKAIMLFQEMKLVEVLDNGAIYMLDIQNFIGETSSEADRIRKYRKQIENEKRSNVEMYDESSTNVHQRLEIRDKSIEIKDNTTTVYAIFQNEIGTLSPLIHERLDYWLSDFDESIVIYAIKLAAESNVRRWAYIDSILKSWSDHSVKTIEDVKALQANHKRKTKGVSNGITKKVENGFDAWLAESELS